MIYKMTIKIIITILVLSATLFVIRFIWTKEIDFRKLFKSKLPQIPPIEAAPVIEYGITSMLTKYKVNQEIDGIIWRSNYSKHLLTIINTTEDLYNAIVSIHYPGAIVVQETKSIVNAYNLTFSQFNEPFTIGSKSNPSFITENAISNSVDISIEKVNKHSTITIEFILDYRFKPDGYWQFDISYEYFNKGNNSKYRHRIINPIEIRSEKPLILGVYKSIDYTGRDNVKCSQDIYPFTPIISEPDGSWKQIIDYTGDWNGLSGSLGKGERALGFAGFDYVVNTDKEFK